MHLNLIKHCGTISKTCFVFRSVTTSSPRSLDQRWREKKGLPANPNAFGPLTNLPDYTYLDGRPTPLGSNMRKRVLRQQEMAQEIVTFNKELAFAKERHARLKQNKIDTKNEIISNKLKPKGHLLLKK